MQDLAANPQLSSKDYLLEAKGLYMPAAFCPEALRSMVMETPGRTEVRYVEQCRAYGYKILRTSLECIFEGGKSARQKSGAPAKIRTRCEVDGQNFSPCLKRDLDKIFLR